MRIEQVEVYNVNGYKVCAKEKKDLEKYLEDVPKDCIFNKDYEGVKYIGVLGNEFRDNKCKELNHLKINELFDNEDDILNKVV